MSVMGKFLASKLTNTDSHRKSYKIMNVDDHKAQQFVSYAMSVTERFLASNSEIQICTENIRISNIF